MRLRPTLAIGYDAVLPIDPSIYEITEDARGRAYAFDMADAREDVADTVRSVLDRPQDVDHIEVAPGYLRVRVAPTDPVKPTAFLEALRSVRDEYNRRYATAPDLDGLAFANSRYLGTYRPADAPEREAFLDRHADADAVPDADGPVWTYDRDGAGEDVLPSNQRCRYRIALPFDPSMYEATTTLGGGTGTPPVRWDAEAVRTALRVTVEDIPAWPKRAENTPRIAVSPGYLLVEHDTGSLRFDPVQLAENVATAFLRYNRYRNVDEERSTTHKTQLHPPIAFDGNVYVAGRDPAHGADVWISDHSLDAVDGKPVDPAPEDEESDDTGGVLSRFTG